MRRVEEGRGYAAIFFGLVGRHHDGSVHYVPDDHGGSGAGAAGDGRQKRGVTPGHGDTPSVGGFLVRLEKHS